MIIISHWIILNYSPPKNSPKCSPLPLYNAPSTRSLHIVLLFFFHFSVLPTIWYYWFFFSAFGQWYRQAFRGKSAVSIVNPINSTANCTHVSVEQASRFLFFFLQLFLRSFWKISRTIREYRSCSRLKCFRREVNIIVKQQIWRMHNTIIVFTSWQLLFSEKRFWKN